MRATEAVPVARAQREVFDEVAETYDRARAGYPERLFDDVLAFAALGPGERVLEIGAGTGKATLGFARRGCRLLCLEPGARLAALLRENCRDHPGVDVMQARFEDQPLEPGAFGMVVAAQSMHWIDAQQAFTRSAAALRAGGTLALFWNRPLRGESELHRAIEACYSEHAPTLGTLVAKYAARRWDDEIDASGCFGTVFQARYPFHREYGTDGYLDLLRTQSDHRMLDEPAREALLADLGRAVAAHGGRIRIDYRTDLLLSRRQ
jgi:SAM-dependent methyltransferase